MFLELLLIPFFTIINRVRGMPPPDLIKKLGLRMLFVSLIFIFLFLFGLTFFTTLSVSTALVFATTWTLIFFAWGLLGWGRWFDLGRLPENWNRKNLPPKPPELIWIWKYIPFIKIDPDWFFELPTKALKIPFGWAFDYITLSNRMLILLPLVGVAVYLGIFSINFLFVVGIAAVIMPLCYEVAWIVREKYKKDTDVLELGEYLVGLVWGHMVLLSIII